MEKLKTINERIKYVLDHEGHTVATFARKCGLPDQTIRSYVIGTREPGFKILSKILTAEPWVDANWLILGEYRAASGGTGITDVKELQKLHAIIDRQAKMIEKQQEDVRRLTDRLLGDAAPESLKESAHVG